MDAFFQYLTEEVQVWEQYAFTDTDQIEVSEVWGNSSSSVSTTAHHTIASNDVELWSKQLTRTFNGETQSCAFRMVWIEHKPKEDTNDISRELYARLVEAFHLRLSHGYYRTSFAGVNSLSRDEDSETRQYSFGIHPKVALCWSYNVAEQMTQGLCLASTAQIQTLKKLLDVNRTGIDQDMTIALCCSMMLGGEIDREQSVIKTEIRKVEVRTGHHRWTSRNEAAAKGALSALSAKMSGCATKTASIVRKARVIEELNKFVLEQLELQGNPSKKDQDSDSEMERRRRRREEVREKIVQVDKRSAMQQMDTDFFRQRIEIQLQALFNMIAQNDALVGHEVAMDSKLLALASQRDSSSMKSLSIVTMFFLPGTFVASFFSMPVLDWSTSEIGYRVNVKPGFVLYWFITIPLTLLTFLIWGLWTLSQRLKYRKQNADAKVQLNHNLTEIGAIEARKSISFKSQHQQH